MMKRVWHQRNLLQHWRDVVINVLHKTKDRTKCGNYRGILLVAYASKVSLMIDTIRLRAYCEAKGLPLDVGAGTDNQAGVAST